MGIYIKQNVSHLAHQPQEPKCTMARRGEEMDFDDYVVVEVSAEEETNTIEIARFPTSGAGDNAWKLARERFLQVFNQMRLPCKLFGRIYN